MKRCIQCGNEFNNKNSHYCSNCGHNLSDTKEHADTLLFWSKVLRVLGIVVTVLFT